MPRPVDGPGLRVRDSNPHTLRARAISQGLRLQGHSGPNTGADRTSGLLSVLTEVRDPCSIQNLRFDPAMKCTSIGLGVVALLTVASCGGDSDSTATAGAALRASLADRAFVSESVEGWTLVEGSEVRVWFSATDAMASAGCNSWGGPYELVDGKLVLNRLGGTAVACVGDLGDQDTWIVDLISAAPSLVLDEPRLTLTTPDFRLTLLDRELASPDRLLVGTTWVGTTYFDAMIGESSPAWEGTRLNFSETGTVSIDTTCGLGNGTFEANETSVAFTDLTYTDSACADAQAQAISAQIRRVLDGSALEYDIEERLLTLRNGDEGLMFRAQ